MKIFILFFMIVVSITTISYADDAKPSWLDAYNTTPAWKSDPAPTYATGCSSNGNCPPPSGRIIYPGDAGYDYSKVPTNSGGRNTGEVHTIPK